ncbi:hypothetical protein CIPAW_13G104200 [Carya illinoinensis]|uniref:Uncharacterized protein n=1 Tax=Carya illinoinensis TaxID=32201 RepID=A0A8T1NMM3_CARIL|nr:hypothetical protein CIPAW_13G104200 [Carya illinoinensis]
MQARTIASEAVIDLVSKVIINKIGEGVWVERAQDMDGNIVKEVEDPVQAWLIFVISL